MSVPDKPFQFSVSKHAIFIAGYMDAVARSLTTDSVLCGLTARDAKEVLDGDLAFGAAVRAKVEVQSWSKEFAALVDNFFPGLNQRSRLGFYLLEYISWFSEFTDNARCLKLDCDLIEPRTMAQAVYLLELDGDHHVVLLAQLLNKLHNNPLQDDAPKARA